MAQKHETKDKPEGASAGPVQPGPDPRLEDESRLAEIRRKIEEVASDAPQLAKIALEAMVHRHNPELKGTSQTAGRAGRQSGNVSELTAFATLKPDGEGAVLYDALAEAVQMLTPRLRGKRGVILLSLLHI
mgnify:CR=1 FL=1